MTCDHMSMTYTTSYGKANDCHASRCRNLYVSRRDCAVFIAGRAVEYEKPMRVGSLFSGIGGLDLGLERAGMDVIWQSEIDPYACKVLDKHWPTVPNLGNIKEIDWSQVERPDVICGGYPCQPFSTAGKRQGEGDARHLWPWVRECIAELRPRYAVLENVRGHLSLGFGTVLGDLASIGYDTEWQVIPAAAVGAPHRRDRVFIVAYSTQQSSNERGHASNQRTIEQWQGIQKPIRGSSSTKELANTVVIGQSLQVAGQHASSEQFASDGSKRRIRKDVANTNSASRQQQRERQVQESDIGGCSDSRQWWAIEPDVGRVAHGVPNRVDRLRCLGNAVVPQVAEYVGRLIMAAQ